jgi:hypothetical protein
MFPTIYFLAKRRNLSYLDKGMLINWISYMFSMLDSMGEQRDGKKHEGNLFLENCYSIGDKGEQIKNPLKNPLVNNVGVTNTKKKPFSVRKEFVFRNISIFNQYVLANQKDVLNNEATNKSTDDLSKKILNQVFGPWFNEMIKQK